MSQQHKIAIGYRGLEKPRMHHRTKPQPSWVKLRIKKVFTPVLPDQQRFSLSVDPHKQGLMVDHAYEQRGRLPGVFFLQLAIA